MTEFASHPKVVLVVDPAFGERLAPVARHDHVWVCESAANRAAADNCWKKSGSSSRECAVTVFQMRQDASPEEACVEVLWTVDLHHGQYSQDPAWSVIEVIGARPTAAVRQAFSEFGVEVFEETEVGFMARRPVPEEP